MNGEWIILLWALLDVVFLVMKNSGRTKKYVQGTHDRNRPFGCATRDASA